MEMLKLNYKFGILLVNKDLERLLVHIIKELMASLWSMISLLKALSKILLIFGLER